MEIHVVNLHVIGLEFKNVPIISEAINGAIKDMLKESILRSVA